MKVLFLDIDGVMNNDAEFKRQKVVDPIGQEQLEILKHIIDQTGADIVLSSSWRCSQELGVKVSKALESVGLHLISHTPYMPEGPRSGEIQTWLDEHKETTQFAILDDDGDANIEGHFFQTQFKDGLTKEIAQAVIDHLNEKPQRSQASL